MLATPERTFETMTHDFDKEYWERHWQEAVPGAPGATEGNPPNPYLIRGVGLLEPGTALDAGCGAGAEAIWLASHGWRVTAVDISADALSRASSRASQAGVAGSVAWVEADLTTWSPDEAFDLVTSYYAHPSIPQLDFYTRLAMWVAPGGSLLIVGHLSDPDGAGDSDHGHGHHHPPEASVAVEEIASGLDPAVWEIVEAEEAVRTLGGSRGESPPLHDAVVWARRLT